MLLVEVSESLVNGKKNLLSLVHFTEQTIVQHPWWFLFPTLVQSHFATISLCLSAFNLSLIRSHLTTAHKMSVNAFILRDFLCIGYYGFFAAASWETDTRTVYFYGTLYYQRSNKGCWYDACLWLIYCARDS